MQLILLLLTAYFLPQNLIIASNKSLFSKSGCKPDCNIAEPLSKQQHTWLKKSANHSKTHISIGKNATRGTLTSIIEALPKMQSLRLENCEAVSDELEKISSLRSLTSLTMRKVPVISYAFLGKMQNLRQLTIEPAPLTFEPQIKSLPNALAKLRRLQSLSIANLPLASLDTIKQIKISQLSIKNLPLRSLTFIKELKSLKTLEIGALPPLTIPDLGELKKLKKISITRNIIADTTFLENALGLSSITLKKTKIRNLDALAGMQTLQELIIPGIQLENWEFLRELKLQNLDLSHTNFEKPKILSHMNSLKKLDLSDTYITSISNLSHLKKLNMLDITDTEVELSELELFTNTSQIYVNAKEISKKLLRSLQKSSPRLRLHSHNLKNLD